MELAVRKSAAWLLCRDGSSRGLLVVCFKSTLRDQKLPQRKNLVAQTVVGAGPCFILVFTHHRHRTNLFRKSCYLNRNQESSGLLTRGNNIVEGYPTIQWLVTFQLLNRRQTLDRASLGARISG